MGAPGEFTRDPADWLRRLSPDEWIRAALGELKRAEHAYGAGNTRAGAAGVKRAAGMALNGALLVEPDEAWGRAYVEHVAALARDQRVPEAVRAACRTVLAEMPPTGEVVVLRTPKAHEAVLEAARDVIAHAWAVVRRHDPKRD
jgi:HEPN domain-containing protein